MARRAQGHRLGLEGQARESYDGMESLMLVGALGLLSAFLLNLLGT